MKKLALTITGLMLFGATFSQQATKSFAEDPFNHPMLPFYLVSFLVLIVVVLVTVVVLYIIKVINILTEKVKKERAEKLGVAYVPSPGIWERLNQKLNASVPVAQESEIELEHSYDGIKELDNHLPPWWKWLFYGTIGWSVIYIIVFHFSNTLPLSLQEYENEIAVAEEQARRRKALNPQEDINENTLIFVNDAAMITKGKEVFNSNPCGSCHRNDGGGNTIGPNLTDAYWIHGGDVKSVFATIKNGVVDKGMPAWGKAMSPQDLRDLTFYIMSLQGTNPPDAKGPQGELYEPTTTLKSDTLQAQAFLK